MLNRPVIPKKKLSAPSPPTGPITSLTCNHDSITIQWGPPKDDGGAPLTRYVIFARELNTQGWSRCGTVDADTFTYQAQNLTENSEYHFRVVAENYLGASEYLQSEQAFKAKSPYDVPDMPEGPVLVSDITEKSAKIAWKPPLNDGGSPITGYLVKRRDIKRPVWVKCGRVGSGTLKMQIKDLIEGCQYVVQIFAENSEGLSIPLESDQPIKPQRPLGASEPPASFECIGVDVDEVTLQWEAPLIDGGAPIKSYKLEMCPQGKRGKDEESGDGVARWTVVKDEIQAINTSYVVRNLKEGQAYTFRLSATNEVN